MAVLTRLGLGGPSAAYPGFQPKTAQQIIAATADFVVQMPPDDMVVRVPSDDTTVDV